MTQPGASYGDEDIGAVVSDIRTTRERYPDRPVMLGEALYEGAYGGGCRERIQRAMFWACMLSGAAGHCYGANGLWQFNRPEAPFGASQYGYTWSTTAWQEAACYLGSKHVGLGKQLLERYQWWRFEPHQEWIFPAATDEDYFQPYAAGIPGEIRLFYFPCIVRFWRNENYTVRKLEPNIKYHAYYLDPITGKEFPVSDVESTPEGEWVVPRSTIMQDWVLVLEA